MQYVFWLLAFIGALYFLFVRRRFDLLAVSFGSALIYFMPGFFGVVWSPGGILGNYRVIVPGTYAAMCLVLGANLFFALLLDRLAGQLRVRPLELNIDYAGSLAMVLGLVGAGMTVWSLGANLLILPKIDLVQQIGRWHIFWGMGASAGLIFAYLRREWVVFAICLALLCADLFIGFRSSFAIAVMAVATLWVHEKGPQVLFAESKRYIFAALLIGAFLFVYKYLYIAIKLDRWDLVVERLADQRFFQMVFMGSEPFVTQAILNEVVASRFYVGPAHYLNIFYLFVPFADQLGAPIESFNVLFQDELFPAHLAGGLANNIWAEALSAGGWLLLIVFILGHFSLLAAVSVAMRGQSKALLALLAWGGVYAAFYMHRNDLGYHLQLERRVFMIWLVCIAFSAFVVLARPAFLGADSGGRVRESLENDLKPDI